jgi:hypothetical protein
MAAATSDQDQVSARRTAARSSFTLCSLDRDGCGQYAEASSQPIPAIKNPARAASSSQQEKRGKSERQRRPKITPKFALLCSNGNHEIDAPPTQVGAVSSTATYHFPGPFGECCLRVGLQFALPEPSPAAPFLPGLLLGFQSHASHLCQQLAVALDQPFCSMTDHSVPPPRNRIERLRHVRATEVLRRRSRRNVWHWLALNLCSLVTARAGAKGSAIAMDENLRLRRACRGQTPGRGPRAPPW